MSIDSSMSDKIRFVLLSDLEYTLCDHCARIASFARISAVKKKKDDAWSATSKTNYLEV